jgi:pyrimidine-nucleoside phosphorylase
LLAELTRAACCPYNVRMLPQWIIEKKRDGKALAEKDIREFIHGYAAGDIPDYQMAALAMAIFFQGMTFEEVTILTDAMMRSGDLIDTHSLELPTADKHSTGGIGDKVSLILAPLVACCGVAVPMLSGRGLGITGGTLDKLESIPGYRTDLSPEEFLATLAACGCAITGQTAKLAPADKKLYALRDVTGTVPSIPLISASIMSKKLAEGAANLVLDVKWGKGAFMKTLEDARELARTMVAIGHAMGRGMTALLTDMNQPLGRTAGNSLEIIETVEALQGQGPEDMMEVTMALSAEMLLLAGKADTLDSARVQLQAKLASGEAFEKFKEMVELQGGDSSTLDDTRKLPQAELVESLEADTAGIIVEVNADLIGRAVLLLGGGRAQVTDTIDPAVGISKLCKIGDVITAGQQLLDIHANDHNKLDDAKQMAREAVVIAAESENPAPTLIVETIRPKDL